MSNGIAIVGGTFGDQPKASSVIDKMYTTIVQAKAIMKLDRVLYWNGGYTEDLPRLMKELKPYPIVLWFPNVSNDEPKVRDVKAHYPDKCLVISKRNDNNKYSLAAIVNRALQLHANLCVEFTQSPSKNLVTGRVLDPLGNVWCDTTSNVERLSRMLLWKIKDIVSVERRATFEVMGDVPSIPDNPEFFELIRDYANVFHELVDPDKEVERFLGNSSFRCDKGFPSFRSEDLIFMSRRNINKSHIDRNGFVATRLRDDSTSLYWGESKPSVDTPIQLRLYGAYPNINFMIHSHTYIQDAPFTAHHYPCGAIQEVAEILEAVPDRYTTLAYVNLIGHGSLVMSQTVEGLKDVPYIRRPVPEVFWNDE